MIKNCELYVVECSKKSFILAFENCNTPYQINEIKNEIFYGKAEFKKETYILLHFGIKGTQHCTDV
jgi:hypothetical protein